MVGVPYNGHLGHHILHGGAGGVVRVDEDGQSEIVFVLSHGSLRLPEDGLHLLELFYGVHPQHLVGGAGVAQAHPASGLLDEAGTSVR